MHSFSENYKSFLKKVIHCPNPDNIQYSILNYQREYTGLGMEEVALAEINQTLVKVSEKGILLVPSTRKYIILKAAVY